MSTFELEEKISREQVLIVDSAFNYTETESWTDAISRVVMREARILIPRNDGSMIRSAFLTYPHPLVVGIDRYVGAGVRTYTEDSKVTRNTILIRDKWTCYVCKGYGDTMEHIMPESRGGQFTWGNLAVACFKCNGLKGNRTPEEMGWARPVIPKVFVDHRKAAIQEAIHERLARQIELATAPN